MQERIKDGASIHNRFTHLAFVPPGSIRLPNPTHLTVGSVKAGKQDDRQAIRSAAPVVTASLAGVSWRLGRAVVWSEETAHCINDQKQGIPYNSHSQQDIKQDHRQGFPGSAALWGRV
jgi:hypothetical protein